jgi:Flp pilus assembly pilin Flp
MFLRNFWNNEQGQDLIEYTLLMAFVALASAALFVGASQSVKSMSTLTPAEIGDLAIQTIIWLAAGIVLVIFLVRRRKRRSNH